MFFPKQMEVPICGHLLTHLLFLKATTIVTIHPIVVQIIPILD